jgi:hypothetical protein
MPLVKDIFAGIVLLTGTVLCAVTGVVWITAVGAWGLIPGAISAGLIAVGAMNVILQLIISAKE